MSCGNWQVPEFLQSVSRDLRVRIVGGSLYVCFPHKLAVSVTKTSPLMSQKGYYRFSLPCPPDGRRCKVHENPATNELSLLIMPVNEHRGGLKMMGENAIAVCYCFRNALP